MLFFAFGNFEKKFLPTVPSKHRFCSICSNLRFYYKYQT